MDRSILEKIDEDLLKTNYLKNTRLQRRIIIVMELIQMGALLFVIGAISFMPTLLGIPNTDGRWFFQKLFWIKYIVEAAIHLMTWFYFMNPGKYGEGTMDPALVEITQTIGAFGRWALYAGHVFSMLYSLMWIIWGAIVTHKSYLNRIADPPELMANTTVYAFQIVILILIGIDFLSVGAEFVTVFIYLKNIERIRTGEKRFNILGFAKFIDRQGVDPSGFLENNNVGNSQLESLAKASGNRFGGNTNYDMKLGLLNKDYVVAVDDI